MKFISKILVTLIIALACVAFIVLALLPTIASSSWGKEKLLSIANSQIPGNIAVEELSVNWMGPQEISGMVLKDPEGAPILSLKRGVTQSSLFRLLWNRAATGSFEIESLNGTLSTDAAGNTNFEKALNKDCCAPKSSELVKPVVVNFKNVNAIVNLDTRNQQPLTLRITGETQQNTLSGTFVVDAELRGVDVKRLRHFDQKMLDELRASPDVELKVNADIANLPVSLLDQIIALKQPDFAGVLPELLGQQLNLTLRQKATPQGVDFVLNAQSPLLAAAVEASLANDISLAKPATVTLKITPKLIDKLAAITHTPSPWRLQSPTSAQLVIEQFRLPLNVMEGKTLSSLDLTQIALQAKLTLQQATLTGGGVLGTIDVQQLLATLQTEAGSKKATLNILGEAKQNNQPFKINMAATIDKPAKWKDLQNIQKQFTVDGEIKGLPVAALDAHLGMNGKISQAIGNTAELGFSLNTLQNKPIATIRLASDYINIPNISFWVGDELSLVKPAKANIHLSPAFINQIVFAGDADAPQLQEPSSMEINIHKFSMPLASPDASNQNSLLDATTLEADIGVSQLLVDHIPSLGNVALKDFILRIDGKSVANAKCSATCTLSQLNTEGLINDILGPQTTFTSSAMLRLTADDNTPFIDAFDVQIINDLLQKIDLHWAIDTSSHALKIDVRSPHINGTAHLKYDQGISLGDPNQPAVFDLNLTPNGYAALRNLLNEDAAADFKLAEPARVTMRLKSLNMPRDAATGTLPYWKSAIGADISIDRLVGIDRITQHQVTLNDIQGQIVSQDISQHTAFNMKAEGQTTNGKSTTLNIVGALERGFNSDGSINHHDLSLSLDATVDNLPIPLLCQLACLNPSMYQKLDALIGPTLDAKIKAQLQQMNGPVYVDLKGKNGRTILDARLTNGNMTLNNNFYAELNATPQLGQYVLQDVIPFLSGMIGSDQPLKLAIAKEGFSLPVRNFALQNVSIGGATLELGKVRFSNQGQLAKVLSLLTTASANEIMVWLTPTYFSMNNGVFKLERVDMLISDLYPIAAWGKVDTLNDNVNMVIALSGSAISRAFNVQGIKRNYYLQLPLRGTMSNASIDKSKAVARLSALVAQSQGGPHGLVLGTVLDIATGGLTEESPPKPTTSPLPWNSLMEEPKETDGNPVKEANKEINEQIDKVIPIEQIGKGAGKLIKKLLK